VLYLWVASLEVANIATYLICISPEIQIA
jgi:hypothetical protein